MSEQPEGAPPPANQPQIILDKAQMAGVWSNFARVSHSPYEFTIDFARLDFAERPPTGIVVSRVSLSPLMISQLIDALQQNWAIYAEKALPPEWRPPRGEQPEGRGDRPDGSSDRD